MNEEKKTEKVSLKDLQQKIRNQDIEIEFLKKKLDNELKIEESRFKALKLEILDEARKEGKKRLLTLIPVLALFISILGFLGYENIKHSILNQIDISGLQEKVLLAAKEEIQDIENIKTRSQEQERETERIHDKLLQIVQTVEENKIESESIIKSFTPEVKRQIDDQLRSRYFEKTGLSTETTIAILVKETTFNIKSYDYPSLKYSITELQLKYGLRPDGIIGPVTSLVIMAIAVKENEKEALENIKANNLRPLLSMHQFLYAEKELIKMIENKQHNLHNSIMKVLKITDNIYTSEEALKIIKKY